MRLRVRFDPHAPILLGTGVGLQQVRESADVIPGGAVLGAIARILLQADGTFRENPLLPDPEVDHETASLLAGLYFSPLYPVPASRAGGTHWHGVEGYTAPSSARTCKNNPGFRDLAGTAETGGHGVVDLLLHLLERGQKGGRTHPATSAHPPRCPVNQEHRLARFRSRIYREPDPSGGWVYEEVAIPKTTRTRVGLNRYTETAEEGILFQVEPLEPRVRRGATSASAVHESTHEQGFVFLGDAWMPDDLWPALRSRLGVMGAGPLDLRIAVGGGRARGYGDGTLTLAPVTPAEPLAPVGPVPTPAAHLLERLERFRDACMQRGFDRDLLVPALLRSPWPLTDPSRDPGDEVLWSAPPPADLADRLTCEPELSAMETEPWGAWSMAWGLPRTRRPALAAGSVVVFRLAEYDPQSDRETLLSWLQEREERPWGTEPGTGWVTWFDPFHLDHAADGRQ